MDSIVYRVKAGPVMEKEFGVWGGELKNWVRVARKIICSLISMILSHHRCHSHLIFILIKQSVHCALTRIFA